MAEKTNETPRRVTAKERDSLERLIRDRQRDLRARAKQRVAQQLADLEEQVATSDKPDDERGDA